MMIRFISLTFFVIIFTLQACNQSNTSKDSTKTELELLTEQIEKSPDDANLYRKRAEIYKQNQDYENAIKDAQLAIEYDNKNLDNFLFLADLYLVTNQIQGTINSLNSILVIEPQNINANLKMAELNLMFKRYNEAIKNANIVLNVDPYNSKAYFIKGFTFKEFGDTTKAVSSFLEAVKQNPEFYNAYVELGNLFREKKDPICIQYYQNAIDADPSKTDSYYNLGLYYQQNDMLNEAQDAYRKIIEIDPTFPYSYYNIGYIMLEILSLPEEATKYFAKAIECKPDYYEAHYNLGLCLERVGNLQQAIQSYQNALKYQNNYARAIEALNRVDDILKR